MILSLLSCFWGASFPCAKAIHPVEKKICADSRLSALDDSLGRSWKAAQLGLSASDAVLLKAEQKAWLAEARDQNPSTSELLAIWSRRRDELEFKRGIGDLRTLVQGRSREAWRVRQDGTCITIANMETMKESRTGDELTLKWVPKRDVLQFGLSLGIMPQCSSCDLEGEAHRVASADDRVLRWRWEGNSEGRAKVEIEIGADAILVTTNAPNDRAWCGMGAGLPDSTRFWRVQLQLAR